MVCRNYSAPVLRLASGVPVSRTVFSPLKTAKANLTHEAFLFELVRAECIQRDEHRIAHLQRISGLPPDKTFGSLQMNRFPPLIREQLERLAQWCVS